MKKPARSIIVFVVSLIALTIATLLFGYLTRSVSFLRQADEWLYLTIFHMPHIHFLDVIAQPFDYNLFFHVPGIPVAMPTFFYFMIAGFGIYLFLRRRKDLKWFILAIVAGNILVHFISLLDVKLLFRERPFVSLHQTIRPQDYLAWINFSSYPSGHCRDTALYCTIFAYFERKLTWPAILLVAFIMFSRIYQGAHYPSDVIAGTAIGVTVGVLVMMLVNLLRKRLAGKDAA